MVCSQCGVHREATDSDRPFEADSAWEWYCDDCLPWKTVSLGERQFETAILPNGSRVTARIGEIASCTFTPIGSSAPSPVRFREAELIAFQDGAAQTVTCGHCRKERPADHAVLISFGQPLSSSYFFCGPCLDSLAEGLYLHGAERGVPHWRKHGD